MNQEISFATTLKDVLQYRQKINTSILASMAYFPW